MITFKEMKNWALVGLSLFILAGCKKYEDGPWVSLRTKEGRVTAKWEFEYFEVDGVDSTAFLKAAFSEVPFYSFSPVNNRGDRYGSVVRGNFKWSFYHHHDYIDLWEVSAFSAKISPYNNTSVRWEILRLTNKELWMRTDYNQKRYIVHLKKTREIKGWII